MKFLQGAKIIAQSLYQSNHFVRDNLPVGLSTHTQAFTKHIITRKCVAKPSV